jgi:hypothetical protein
LGEILLKKELSQLYEEIYHLQNCELALGEYFQQLALLFPDEKWFWEEAITDEINHARQVGMLIAMVSSGPLKFGSGRYRVAMLETYLGGIYENIEKLERKELSPKEALKIAFDYENSILETKPFDIVSSTAAVFKEFKDKLTPDLLAHSERVRQYTQQKMASLAGVSSAN